MATTKPPKSTAGLLIVLSIIALALPGCTSASSNLTMGVDSAELLPNDSWGNEYLKVNVSITNNHASRDFTTWGDEDVQLTGGPWSAVSKKGQIFEFSDIEGPDGIAAGSSGKVSVSFYAGELDAGDSFATLRYKSGEFSAEAKIPTYETEPGGP